VQNIHPYGAVLVFVGFLCSSRYPCSAQLFLAHRGRIVWKQQWHSLNGRMGLGRRQIHCI